MRIISTKVREDMKTREDSETREDMAIRGSQGSITSRILMIRNHNNITSMQLISEMGTFLQMIHHQLNNHTFQWDSEQTGIVQTGT